jgi:hypothetical protein
VSASSLGRVTMLLLQESEALGKRSTMYIHTRLTDIYLLLYVIQPNLLSHSHHHHHHHHHHQYLKWLSHQPGLPTPAESRDIIRA